MKEVYQLKQELACTQENVAKLVGAGPNAVMVHQPVAAPANPDDPPSQPPTQDCIVDRAAYDALHQAYESLESNFYSSKDSNKELMVKLQNAQIKNDEMVASLEQAKEEYEILAKDRQLTMASKQKQDTVTFVNVQKSYPPGEQLKIGYTLSQELKRSIRDWVGLFKVGWTSIRDFYTFEWAPALADEHLMGEVTFACRRLPPEDIHFYQFCYVTSDGRVHGRSPPFQFLAVSLARVNDLEPFLPLVKGLAPRLE